jgi:hypothetical protein
VSRPAIRLDRNRILMGERFSVALQRTLRIPDDGRIYPLPPGLGVLPVHRVADYADRVPAAWRDRGGFFVPMHQQEALWLGFGAARWKPNAVKVGIGGINAISGEAWDEELHAERQDYLVCPPQLWLDGINAGQGRIRQFVAMPLGLGLTVEAEVRGAELLGGIQLVAYEPRRGVFPDTEPPPARESAARMHALHGRKTGEMGIGAGGRMRQSIYPDPHGLETWDPDRHCATTVHLVNSEQYRQITGVAAPPTPIDARTYTEHGLPWFELHDESLGDLAPPSSLTEVRSVREIAEQRGAASPANDAPVEIPEKQIRRVRGRGDDEAPE